MIVAEGLTKKFGEKTAVDDISFTIEPGIVTGFLGPNGAGKSTTMRMILGLDSPTKGNVIVNGYPYAKLNKPLGEVGALLEAKAVHTGRSARNHLRAMAATHGISKKRVNEVIDMTGLTSVANKRVGQFSLGMGQRLGIAVALLGDPQTLILDEPVNGLDPEGVKWVRNLVRSLAAEGRTVFLSSHLMTEMSMTADRLIVLGRGRILAEGSVDEIVNSITPHYVHVEGPGVSQLAEYIAAPGVTITSNEPSTMDIQGLSAPAIAETAFEHRLLLHQIHEHSGSLEDAFITLTEQSVEYRSGAGASVISEGA